MLYRRSRTERPRASPFVVLSSMEMTLLTVVYAGPQTALDLPGRVRHLSVCLKSHVPKAFRASERAKKSTPAPSQAAPPRFACALLLGTTNRVSPAFPPPHGVV